MSKPWIAVVVGTRPEAIKMAPIIMACREPDIPFDCRVVATAQHRQLLDKALAIFDISPDYDLNIMSLNQTLSEATIGVLKGMQTFFQNNNPELILVQGDTTTAVAASLASYYQKIPVGHVEAGIRTTSIWAPFSEEMNRRLTDQLSSLHFAPTLHEKKNLLNEGISPKTVFVTGNTVIDALNWTIQRCGLAARVPEDPQHKTILVTAHRRESFGYPLRNICRAVRLIATAKPEVTIVFPVHLNPQVNRTVQDELSGFDNIQLIEPVDYPSFIQLMLQSWLILSDSGGIQEEATSLGKPVLVLRNETDRPEAVKKCHCRLVGTDPEQIFATTRILLEDMNEYKRMSQPSDIYGDGQATRRILEIVEAYLASDAEVKLQK